MPTRRLVPLLLTLACAGGTSASDQGTPAPAASPVPCGVPVDSTQGRWLEVRARSITFCVPESWEVSAGRATYRGGSVRWQFTSVRERVTATVTHTVVSEPGAPMTSAPRMDPPLPPELQRTRVREVVGGRIAVLWRGLPAGRVATGATWDAPAVAFSGEANSEADVALQWSIYRTVRFTERK